MIWPSTSLYLPPDLEGGHEEETARREAFSRLTPCLHGESLTSCPKITYCTMERWIHAKLPCKEMPNLTSGALVTYVNELGLPCCNEEPLSVDEGRVMMHHLGYCWTRLKNGYYISKTFEPRAIRARDQYVVAMEALFSTPDMFHLEESQRAQCGPAGRDYRSVFGVARTKLFRIDLYIGSSVPSFVFGFMLRIALASH